MHVHVPLLQYLVAILTLLTFWCVANVDLLIRCYHYNVTTGNQRSIDLIGRVAKWVVSVCQEKVIACKLYDDDDDDDDDDDLEVKYMERDSKIIDSSYKSQLLLESWWTKETPITNQIN